MVGAAKIQNEPHLELANHTQELGPEAAEISSLQPKIKQSQQHIHIQAQARILRVQVPLQ